MNELKNILIFCAGSAAIEILNLINHINSSKKIWNVLGFVDKKNKEDKKLFGFKVFNLKNLPKSDNIFAICGIGNPKLRKIIVEKEILKNNFKLTSIIHPNLIAPQDYSIGNGSAIFPGVVLSHSIKLGLCSWIDTNTTLGHNLFLDDYCTIYSNVVINGDVYIKKCSLIGSGAIISRGIKIGNNVTIGLGTTITKNVKDNTSIINYQRLVSK